MNTVTRGIRNAFRNGIRAGAIVCMLALSIGLALSMLLANKAVGQRIDKVQRSVGNTININPAGIRGFLGGGDALTIDDFKKVKTTSHVTSVDLSLMDRVNSDSTNLESAIELGNFGTRQFHIEGGAIGGATSGTAVVQDQVGSPPDPSKFKPPITVMGASNPLAADAEASGSLKITSGSSFDGNKDASVALIGKSLAEKNSLKAGSTFTAYGTTFTVKGIFDAGNTFSNNQIIMPLPTVQRLSDQAGAITNAVAHVDSALNLASTTKEIQSLFGNQADVSSQAQSVKGTLDSLHGIQNVSFFSLIGATVTAAVIILLTMVMIVRERRREIGVLKAIGSSNLRVIYQFGVEAFTLTVLGAAIGIIVGSLGATPVTKLLANNSDAPASSSESSGPMTFSSAPVQISNGAGPGPNEVRMGGPAGGFSISSRLQKSEAVQGLRNLKANIDPSIVLYGLAGAILVATIGSTAAAGLIARVRPSEVMRAE